MKRLKNRIERLGTYGPETFGDILLTAIIIFFLVLGGLIAIFCAFALFVIPIMALFGKGASFLLWLIPVILVLSIAIAIDMWATNN